MATITEGAFGHDFEMKDFIGQGTFAKVFRCVEKNTGRDFAVKAFQNEDENFDPKLIDNEVDIWRTLQHRNIVSLYKRFHEDSRVWVVLELVSGKTLLDEILNQIVFPEQESRNIILQVRNNYFPDQIQISQCCRMLLKFQIFYDARLYQSFFSPCLILLFALKARVNFSCASKVFVLRCKATDHHAADVC